MPLEKAPSYYLGAALPPSPMQRHRVLSIDQKMGSSNSKPSSVLILDCSASKTKRNKNLLFILHLTDGILLCRSERTLFLKESPVSYILVHFPLAWNVNRFFIKKKKKSSSDLLDALLTVCSDWRLFIIDYQERGTAPKAVSGVLGRLTD